MKKKIDKETETEIVALKGKLKARDIAKKFGVSIHQVHGVMRRNNVTTKHNMVFELTSLEEQIILSGILGDGRLKKNGKYNYYYSECHAMDEAEYCEWKKNSLGELTNSTRIYAKNKNNKYCDAVEFTTKTTPSLIPFANMSKLEIINKLKPEGLALLVLDDGWFNYHSKKGNFYVSGGELSEEELIALADKYNKYGFNTNIIGKKRRDISLHSDDNILLYNILKEFMDMSIDIILKKFKYIFKTNQIK